MTKNQLAAIRERHAYVTQHLSDQTEEGMWLDVHARAAHEDRGALLEAIGTADEPPAVPSAWLKQWNDEIYGEPRMRVDLQPGCEPALAALKPVVTPLYRRDAVNRGEEQ